MMTDMLQVMLDNQLEFQKRLYGVDPKDFFNEERADYIRTMVLALEDELHEALGEVGWKPWADSSHFNRDAYVSELVDAFHFFLNLLLVAGVGAEEFNKRYEMKLAKNHKRQDDGYDGVSTKCPECKRDVNDDGVDCILPTDANSGLCQANVSTKCKRCRRDVNADGVDCVLPFGNRPGYCSVHEDLVR